MHILFFRLEFLKLGTSDSLSQTLLCRMFSSMPAVSILTVRQPKWPLDIAKYPLGDKIVSSQEPLVEVFNCCITPTPILVT